MNLIERFFRGLTGFVPEKSFGSVNGLSDAITSFLGERNANARRYVCRAKGEDILCRIVSARQAMAAPPEG